MSKLLARASYPMFLNCLKYGLPSIAIVVLGMIAWNWLLEEPRPMQVVGTDYFGVKDLSYSAILSDGSHLVVNGLSASGGESIAADGIKASLVHPGGYRQDLEIDEITFDSSDAQSVFVNPWFHQVMPDNSHVVVNAMDGTSGPDRMSARDKVALISWPDKSYHLVVASSIHGSDEWLVFDLRGNAELVWATPDIGERMRISADEFRLYPLRPAFESPGKVHFTFPVGKGVANRMTAVDGQEDRLIKFADGVEVVFNSPRR